MGTYYVECDNSGGPGGDGTGVPGTTDSTRPFVSLRIAADALDGVTGPHTIYCTGGIDDDDGSHGTATFDNHADGITVLPYTGDENTDGVLDTSKYYLSIVSINECIKVTTANITIDNIQFATDGSGNYGGVGVYVYHSPDGANCVVQNCIFKMIYTGSGSSRWPKGVNCTYDPTNPIVRNNIFIDYWTSGNVGAGIYKYNNGSAAFDYNTFIDCYRGIYINASVTLYARNNLFSGCNTDLSEGGANTTTNVTYNFTDIASGSSGLPASQNNSYSASFTFENAAGGDYRMATGSGGENGGTSLKTDGTDAIDVDFVGNDRDDSTPDVGFYEVQAAGGGGTILPQMMAHHL